MLYFSRTVAEGRECANEGSKSTSYLRFPRDQSMDLVEWAAAQNFRSSSSFLSLGISLFIDSLAGPSQCAPYPR